MAIFKPFKHEMDLFMTYDTNSKPKSRLRLRPSGPIHLSTSASMFTSACTSIETDSGSGLGSTYNKSVPLLQSTSNAKHPSASPTPSLFNIPPLSSALTEAKAEESEIATLSTLLELRSLISLSALKPTALAQSRIGAGGGGEGGLMTDEAREVYVYQYGYGWVTANGTETGSGIVNGDSDAKGNSVMTQEGRSSVTGSRQSSRHDQDDDEEDDLDSDDTQRIVHLRGLLLSLQQPQFIASLGTNMSRKELALLFAWMSARDLERSERPSSASHSTHSRSGSDEYGSGILKRPVSNQGSRLDPGKPSNVQSKKVRWGSNTAVQIEPREEEPVKRTGLRPRSTQQPIMHDLIEFD